MTRHSSVFDRWKARGEEVLNQVSTELMRNKHFMKALQTAMQGKEKLDQAAARALKQMNIPTRTEFKKALRRIETLEGEIAALKARPKRRSTPRKKPVPSAEAAPATGSGTSE